MEVVQVEAMENVDGPKIPVEFRCNGCAVAGTVHVRQRREGEDVCDWANHAAAAVGVVHAKTAPLCTCPTADLKFPVSDGKQLGTMRSN